MNVECKRVKHGLLSRVFNPTYSMKTFDGEVLGDVGSDLFNSYKLYHRIAKEFGNDFANTTNMSIVGQTVTFTRLPIFTGNGSTYDTSKHRKFIRFLKHNYATVNVIDPK